MLRSLLPAPLLLALAAAPLAAQGASVPPHPLPTRDSARALRDARSEQSRFEAVRRQHLPWSDGSGGVCDFQDERIGRFCLSFDDGEAAWKAPAEDEAIVRARDRLIERLDSAARIAPGDVWVSGQRVRYLVEARRFDRAREAARECRAAAWWCSALSGYADHYAGDAGAADSAFSVMLRTMPERERRAWTDLSLILDDCTVRLYRRLQGAERARFEERFWALADPFFARPGNDLRSEHFARDLMDALQDRAKSTENLSWGSDLREILMRYGAPTGWERIRPRLGSSDPPSLVSHYSDTDQRVLPPCEAFASDDPTAGVWDGKEPRSKAGYSLPLADSIARWIYPLDHQLAVFRRGDSAVVVAAYSIPRDSVPAGTRVRAALALLAPGSDSPTVALLPDAALQDVLSAETAPGPMLVSVELLSDGARTAARSRRGISVAPLAPGRLALSDLLLLRAPAPLPDSLAAAIAEARGSTRVRPGEELGVYWETYGVAGDQPVPLTLSLRLVDRSKGVVRRLAERIGIANPRDPIRMRWQEPAAAGPATPRALTVQIPADLGAGSYTLELTAEAPGQAPQVAEREVEVEESAAR
jgi:hypothetical protein